MPFQTTLQRRPLDQPVELKDFFEERSVGLSTVHMNLWYEDPATFWNTHIPFHPREISKIFSEVYNQGFLVRIATSKKENKIQFLIQEEDKPSSHVMERVYDMTDKRILKSNIILSQERQGQGLSRLLGMMFMDVDVAFQIPHIRFVAQLSAGGYVWAKSGYELDLNEGTEGLSHNVLSKLEVVRPFLPNDIYEKAKGLAAFENSDDIFHLANMDYDLTGKIEPDEFGKKHDYKVQILKGSCFRRGVPITLGKLLLAGEKWAAVADYNNPVQMKRICEYGGGLMHSLWIPDGCMMQPSAFRLAL